MNPVGIVVGIAVVAFSLGLSWLFARYLVKTSNLTERTAKKMVTLTGVAFVGIVVLTNVMLATTGDFDVMTAFPMEGLDDDAAGRFSNSIPLSQQGSCPRMLCLSIVGCTQRQPHDSELVSAVFCTVKGPS